MDIDLRPALNDAWMRVGDWVEGLINNLPNLIAALLVFALFWGIAALVRRAVEAALRRVSQHRDLNALIATLASVVVVGIGLLLALGVLNLSKTVTTLLAGAGILGLALGFAFQDIAENFISGVLLMFRRPFRDGDIIESGDFLGTVRRINMRATLIDTFEGQRVIMPNSAVFKNPVVNYSVGGLRRVDVAVGVSYGDDLEKARRVAIHAVESLEQRDPSRDVELFFEEFGGSSINFQLRFWVRFQGWTDFLHARSEAIIAIKKAFDANDVSIPFPITTLDFSEVGGATLSAAWPGPGRRQG